MLEMTGLHKHFRGVHAVNGVSLKMREGSVLALVGDNGAGKSTLMKCASGALRPDCGLVVFNGQDLSKAAPEAARRAGIEMIYQDLSLCPQQDVVANVFLGREKRKGLFLDSRAMTHKCQSVFSELGAELNLRSAVGRLSGGQQQSVAIARALIGKPKLLIMDEPTAALAVKETNRVLRLILQLKKSAVSVVMITHRLSDIFEVADRIIVMRHGEVTHDLLPAETDIKDLTSKILGGA